jgi:hypothetical protein
LKRDLYQQIGALLEKDKEEMIHERALHVKTVEELKSIAKEEERKSESQLNVERAKITIVNEFI